MFRAKYHLNPETLLFEKVRIPLRKKVRNGVLGFMVMSAVAAGGRLLLDKHFDSPRIKYFTERNQELRNAYSDLNESINGAESVLSDIQNRDDKVYRSVFDMDPIPGSVREAGFGGSENYEGMLLSRKDRIVSTTARKLEKLSMKARIQSKSLTDLYLKATEQQKFISHRPSIQPISPADHYWLTSTFGYRSDPFTGARKMHAGLDMAGNIGLSIYATGDGVVTSAQFNPYGYGREIQINHGFGYSSIYGHLSKILVKKGERIKRGQLIGELGSTGRSTGPHLHYEIRYHDRAINPLYYFYENLSPGEFFKMTAQANN
jgi:murein DD-endopeptidase MepM/ murein hydrolase activator NlpD